MRLVPVFSDNGQEHDQTEVYIKLKTRQTESVAVPYGNSPECLAPSRYVGNFRCHVTCADKQNELHISFSDLHYITHITLVIPNVDHLQTQLTSPLCRSPSKLLPSRSALGLSQGVAFTLSGR